MVRRDAGTRNWTPWQQRRALPPARHSILAFRHFAPRARALPIVGYRSQEVAAALVVTPEGFPVAYEAMPGNTADNTTLCAFLDKIERLHGKARRIWLMDRGIRTEETLAELRRRGGQYVVGTPKGRLAKLAKKPVPYE